MNSIRIAIILFVNAVLQGSMFSRVAFFGANLNMSLPVTVSMGLLMGPITGSLCGLILGLFEDMQTGTAIGVRGLLYFLIGFGAGLMRLHVNREDPKPAMVITLLATILFFFTYAFINRLLVETTGFLLYLKGPVWIEAVGNALLAWPLFVATRRFLRLPGFYR